jgi:hypothetical protein
MAKDATAGTIESEANAVADAVPVGRCICVTITRLTQCKSECVPDDATSEWAEPVTLRGVKGMRAVPFANVEAAQAREATPHAVMKVPVLLKA